GVEVSVSFLRDWAHPGQLDEYLREVPTGRARYVRTRYWWGGIPGRRNTVKTDANGRFRLAELGRDRIVSLKLGGAGIAWTRLVRSAARRRPGARRRDRRGPRPQGHSAAGEGRREGDRAGGRGGRRVPRALPEYRPAAGPPRRPDEPAPAAGRDLPRGRPARPGGGGGPPRPEAVRAVGRQPEGVLQAGHDAERSVRRVRERPLDRTAPRRRPDPAA